MLYATSTLAFYLLLGLQLVGQRAQAEVRIIIIIAIIAIKNFAIIAIAINIIDGVSSVVRVDIWCDWRLFTTLVSQFFRKKCKLC